MAKEQQGKRCIFCGGYGLSKQHILPNWLNKAFPERHNFHSLKIDNGPNTPPSYKTFQGPLGSKKRRNVCLECNTGWMSNLEELAKPILMKLFLREYTILDSESKNIISTWVAMTHIMMATLDFESLLVPKHEREYFKKNQLPSENWQIWVGHLFNPFTYRAYKSFPDIIKHRSELKPGAEISPDEPNNFLSSMVNVENIIFLSRYINSEVIQFTPLHQMDMYLMKLWPLNQDYETLENKMMLSLQDIDAVLLQDFLKLSLLAKPKR